MRHFSRLHLLCAATTALVLLLGFREWTLLPDGRLHLFVLDVNQGDSILLVSPSGKQVVIDGGPNLALLEHLGKHLPFFDRHLDLLVLTHPDSDHVTALPDVLRQYSVDRIMLTGVAHNLGRYEALLEEAAARDVKVLLPDPSKDIDLGDGVVLDVVWPEPGIFGGDGGNDTSIVLRALYKDTAILLTGDIEEGAEAGILATGADIRADVFKVPHHGSRTSSTLGFLKAVAPKIALISAGHENRFGHPHEDILARYADLGIPVRSTSEEGTLELRF